MALVLLAAEPFIVLSQTQTDGNDTETDSESIIRNDSTKLVIDPDTPSIELPVPRVDPENPDIPDVQENEAVGTSNGSFSVNASGAAEYAIAINCPYGGSLTPQVSLVYNSQNAAYGLAGYGFTLNGISAITRGEKTLYNNHGSIKGVNYDSDDNLFLDGSRLVLMTGSAFQDGATYCLEGDPYTKIIVHGSYDDTTSNTWFEVKSSDGTTYYYGSELNGRISCENNAGEECIASWYVNRMEDTYGNYVTYGYTIRNYYAYPAVISYGMNSNRSRGIVNKILFEYESLGDNSSIFNIGGQKGKIDQCISSIVTTSNSAVYRRYNLTYNHNSDFSSCAYSRLIRLQEENGSGEKLKPVSFLWSEVHAGNVTSSQIAIPTTEDNSLVTELDKTFFAADLNGDGVSDIIRVSPVKVTYYTGSGSSAWNNETRVYISRSTMSNSGEVSYQNPVVFTLPSSISMTDIQYTMGGCSLLDIDGDGYNDLIIPYHDYTKGQCNDAVFYIIMGSDVKTGTGGRAKFFRIPLKSASQHPLFITSDIDRDGKDDVVYVEQEKTGEVYSAGVVRIKDGLTVSNQQFSVALPKQPKRLFCGDYNNDGLSDIILLYEGGYKIYFNSGGTESSSKYTETNSFTGTGLCDQWRIQQGDFDGDGLIDFVYNVSGETFLWIARNNGDGTFSSCKSDDIGIQDRASSKDDTRFSIMVYDIDRDGRSDAFICKAVYGYPDSPLLKNEYRNTQVRWMYSDGNTLRLKNSNKKSRENDADEKSIFIGDFNGDGHIELANYGSRLNTTDDSFEENRLFIYGNANHNSNTGRITRITDGLDNRIDIKYSYATSPDVYSRGMSTSGQYPVNTYTLPLSVVKNVTSSNGVAGSQTHLYSYRDFKIHMTGGGPLGFAEYSCINTTTCEQSHTAVTKWDTRRWIPTEVRTINNIGGKSSTSLTTYKIVNIYDTYFAYEANGTVTDMDGNSVTTISNYDLSKGVLLDKTAQNDGDNMYKKVAYSGYEKHGGRWLPTTMTLTQKHADDASAYTSKIRYSYDDKGNTLTTIANYGTEHALTTTCTYDIYGNTLTGVTTGKGINAVKKINEYDSSGRYVVKTYTAPESAVYTYTYDTWGNILSESDATNPDGILTTTHTYDTWGRRTTTLAPDGTESTYRTGWGESNDKKYYTFTSTKGSPWVLTWYDNAGHEVRQETFGPMNVLISRETSYYARGLVYEIKQTNGRFKQTESIYYDELGRVECRELSSGKETTYSYGNRSVTTTSAGRSHTQTVDAWGNARTSVDAIGGEVSYTYSSNGQPTAITSNGSTVTMTYDEAGNRISMTDPDAGTTTYEYAADGRLIKQTDAKGVETVNTYDELGRLSTTSVGNNTIVNTYGTSGNSNLRLIKTEMSDKSIEYTYDNLGRMKSAVRRMPGNNMLMYIYNYNSQNKLSSIVYPGFLLVNYTYDDYGFVTEIKTSNKKIFELKKYTGLEFKSAFMDQVTLTRTYDSNGYESSRRLDGSILANTEVHPVLPPNSSNGILTANNQTIFERATMVDKVDSKYDPLTGNLLSRKRHGATGTLQFSYDDLDRLVSVDNVITTSGLNATKNIMSISYEPNGNIASKTGIGDYSYNEEFRPHAVMAVDNTSKKIPTEALVTTFNDFGKIQTIEDESCGRRMDFSYGPDLQRWTSTLSSNGKDSISTVYAGNYEKITENGVTREFYYLDGSAIIVRENGRRQCYFAFTDNQGSLLSVVDSVGNKVFDASYDAWGQQTVTLNKIGLRRGYTGHEMLPDFGIINMNGRLYDPLLGRFFSPDNYVQLPGFTQSYNRYSYCLNNPLKYTDPSGQLFGIDDAFIAFSIFSAANSMIHAGASGGNIWRAGISSLISSAASIGIGKLFGEVGTVGHELLRAGAHGLAGGVCGLLNGGGFGSGFASGAVSSGMESYTQLAKMPLTLRILSSTAIGGTSAWLVGGDFISGAFNGLNVALLNFEEDKSAPLYYNNKGELYGDLQEIVCIGYAPISMKQNPVKKPIPITPNKTNDSCDSMGWGFCIEFAAGANDVTDAFGSALKRYSGNSTYSSNGELVFRERTVRAVRGRKNMNVIRLEKVGKNITNFTRKSTALIGIVQISDAYHTDMVLSRIQGHNNYYNTVRTVSQLVCGYFGSEFGFSTGGFIGSIGGPAGSIVGATSLGIYFGYKGDEIGGYIVDKLYGK